MVSEIPTEEQLSNKKLSWVMKSLTEKLKHLEARCEVVSIMPNHFYLYTRTDIMQDTLELEDTLGRFFEIHKTRGLWYLSMIGGRTEHNKESGKRIVQVCKY